MLKRSIYNADWPYRDIFNNALLELQEQGDLARLKNKWWKEVGAKVCGVRNRDIYHTNLFTSLIILIKLI